MNEELELTPMEKLVIEEMQRGVFLQKFDRVEALSNNGYAAKSALKAGTIKKLVKAGLIETSITGSGRYFLTGEGLTYGREKK